MMKVIHTWDDEFDAHWRDGLMKIPGATPMYSSGVRKYDNELFSGHLKRDDSFIVLSDSAEVVALVPLYCFEDESGILQYRYSGEYLRSPIIHDSPYIKEYEKLQKFIFTYIEELAKKNSVSNHKAMIEGVELIEGRHYYNWLTDFGYVDESSVCQLIDCSKNNKELWTDLRKSYKPLINKAAKNFEYETVSHSNYSFEKCEDYRKLHFKAIGKQTRSKESFHLMYEMIKNNEAFVGFIKQKDERPVAAHVFFVLNKYCLYASSAVDPELSSNSGIGHMGLWQAIVTAHNMGCRFIDMGQLWINPNPSEKERNIALFKRGFGGRTVTVFRGTKHFGDVFK